MDAFEYVKTKARMCRSYSSCTECPLCNYQCSDMYYKEDEDITAIIKIVEAWGEKHPGKKRQDNLLKIFPDATISGLTKASVICPMDVSKNVECRGKGDENCHDCKREYWLEEVEE